MRLRVQELGLWHQTAQEQQQQHLGPPAHAIATLGDLLLKQAYVNLTYNFL